MQRLSKGRAGSSRVVSVASAKILSKRHPSFSKRASGFGSKVFRIKTNAVCDDIAVVRTTPSIDPSHQDSLTGLFGRAYLDEYLGELASNSDEKAFAVLFVDLDRFKWVNDSLGHQAGDTVLKIAALRLREAVRDDDVIARFGGDEFVIVMPDVQSVGVTTKIAKRIVVELNKPIVIDGRQSGVGASVGIALSDGSSTSADILRQADMALYEAKARGRGRHVIFDHRLAEKADRRMSVEMAVRSAIELDCLDIHFQPIVSMADRSVVGNEALARLEHPELGHLSPAEFVPLAGDLGLMPVMGQWLRRHSFGRHRSLGLSSHISLNLSGPEITRPSIVDEILADTEEFGITPSSICFEINEDILIHEEMRALHTLQRIREAGFLLSLDDFGTGHASLTALRTIQVDEVKIDRSFVSGVEDCAVDRSICQAVAVLAEGAGARVVAEGVETEGQFRVLQELGVHLGQGYLFGKPEALL